MADYSLFGWRIRSELELPGIALWTGSDQLPDIQFTLGHVPRSLPDAQHLGPALQLAPTAQVRLAIPEVAAYLVDGNSKVTIDPSMPVDAPDLRVFLLGTVLSILCFRRGILPLHASGVKIDGRAVLFSGPSGVGKSSLSAAMLERGHTLIADDVCPLRGQFILPATQRLRLWKDVMDTIGISESGLDHSRRDLAKFHVPVADFINSPVPVGSLFVLNRTENNTPLAIAPLKPLQMMKVMSKVIYRYRLGVALGHQAEIFAAYTALTGSVLMRTLSHGGSLTQLRNFAATVEAQL